MVEPVTESPRVSRRTVLLGVGGAALAGLAGAGGYAIGASGSSGSAAAGKPGSTGAAAAADAGPPKYRSRPDLRTLPDVTITTPANGTVPGYVFLTPASG